MISVWLACLIDACDPHSINAHRPNDSCLTPITSVETARRLLAR